MSETNRRRTAINFIIKSRTDRRKYFPEWLFSDPAWDILLAAYAAGLDDQDGPVSIVAEAANLHESTVQRWISALEKEGLMLRHADILGDRVSLSEKGRLAMDNYVEGLSSNILLMPLE